MDSEAESPENGTLSEEIASLPQSYAFTVHFDSGKSGGETTNKFARKHIRNLSLPISKVYENKVNNESVVNGKTTRKAGNHSEGYFSSDPDDDSKPKLFEMKLKHTDIKGVKSTNAAQERRGEVVGVEVDKDDDTSSDVVSETGTYTIDKDSPEVETARRSIDTVFGVSHTSTSETTKNNQVNSTLTKSTKVTEWLEHSTITTKTDTTSTSTSKIPSPVNLRSRLPAVTPSEPLRPSLNRKSYHATTPQELTTPEPDRDRWAKETERTISVLQARVSQSLDSGGESDAENSLGHATERRDSGGSHPQLRYNRSVSLRRDRLQEAKKNSASSSVTNKAKEIPVKAIPPRVMKRMSDPPPASAPVSSFARTDCGRFSMRSPRPLHQTPLTPVPKKEPVRKMSIGGSGRSNSTLSSKEKEYQNWKKRKSYDPMKAAAEGKKKEAAKKQVPSAMTQSTNSTITTPKSPVNPVLRSASFHGTRQLTVSSSEEEEEEITLSNEDEDWPVLQVPRSSLENTPQGSRVSLYSNTSNSPTPPLRNRPKLEGVDTLVISALAGLSSKLKGSSCNLLNKLRFLYDEDSPKNHQLSAMIDQLDASEPGSPQVRSPSRELATTLRNLKRLESMLKVLDNVLFDEEEFQ